MSLLLIGQGIVRTFGRRRNLKIRRQEILNKFLLFAALISTIFILIVIWGISIHNLWIYISSFIGLFGIALVASWSLLSNIISAFILFFTVPFHIGDTIELRDNDELITGVVEDLTLFYVFMRKEDSKVVTIPNSVVMQRIIVRHSRKKSSEHKVELD